MQKIACFAKKCMQKAKKYIKSRKK